MIGRRSLMAMIGLAPVAAVTKDPDPHFTHSIGEAIPMGYNGVSVARAGDEVKDAKQAYDRLKWLYKEGLAEDEQLLYGTCRCIESRKATSPAIKAILHSEAAKKQELLRAEHRWKHALAKKMAPDWVRALFS